MKTTTLAIALLLAAITTGCVTTVPLTTTFDPSEVAFIKEQGTNTIEGSALIRQRGGGVVNCAGYQVNLIPRGAYAEERMKIIYGTAWNSAFRQYNFGGQRPPTPDPAYLSNSRNAVCDTLGKFVFRNVAAGSYFIITEIRWEVGEYSIIPEGGLLMSPITFAGTDETKTVVLSP